MNLKKALRAVPALLILAATAAAAGEPVPRAPLILAATAAAAVPNTVPRDPPVPPTGLNRLYSLSCVAGPVPADPAPAGFRWEWSPVSCRYEAAPVCPPTAKPACETEGRDKEWSTNACAWEDAADSTPPPPPAEGKRHAWSESACAWETVAVDPPDCEDGKRPEWNAQAQPPAWACKPCPTHRVCAFGTLVLQRYCEAGDPPGDAFMGTETYCDSGNTRTRPVCVDHGATAPDNPCTLADCGSNERLVGGSCEACPAYQACSGNSLVTRYHCEAGNAPPDAFMGTETYCDSGNTRTRPVCVDGGGSAPADTPCTSADCGSNERLVGDACETCPTYQACSGNSLVTRNWCSAGSAPADSRTVSYDICDGSNNLVSTTACVAAGSPDPVSATNCSCPPGQYWDSGLSRCEACGTYEICQGNVTATAQWCQSSAAPGDAFTDSYTRCDTNTGTTETVSTCFAHGATVPASTACPAPPTCNGGVEPQWNSGTESWYCPACPPTAEPACAQGQRNVWNDTTCQWDTSPVPQPSTTACESASWNSGSCSWTVTDNTPAAPGHACGDVFDAATCSYSAAPAPSAPDTTACESASFNSATCSWTVTDNTPSAPGHACGDVFDSATCSYSAAPAPSAPSTTACESASFNAATCSWTVTDNTPSAPGHACGDVFDAATCSYSAAPAPSAPDTTACESASFDAATCSWTVTDNTPSAPTGLTACQAASFDAATCSYTIVDITPSPPGNACGDVFDAATCSYSAAPAPSAPGNACGDVFDSATCSWSAAPAPSAPGNACGDVFDAATCSYSAADPPPAPGNACGDIFDSATCSWSAADPPAAPGNACGDVFDSATCSWSAAPAPAEPICNGTLSFDSASCSWDCVPPPPSCPDGTVGTPPDCETPMCPDGTVGTPPNCVESCVPPPAPVPGYWEVPGPMEITYYLWEFDEESCSWFLTSGTYY